MRSSMVGSKKLKKSVKKENELNKATSGGEACCAP